MLKENLMFFLLSFSLVLGCIVSTILSNTGTLFDDAIFLRSSAM